MTSVKVHVVKDYYLKILLKVWYYDMWNMYPKDFFMKSVLPQPKEYLRNYGAKYSYTNMAHVYIVTWLDGSDSHRLFLKLPGRHYSLNEAKIVGH